MLNLTRIRFPRNNFSPRSPLHCGCCCNCLFFSRLSFPFFLDGRSVGRVILQPVCEQFSGKKKKKLAALDGAFPHLVHCGRIEDPTRRGSACTHGRPASHSSSFDVSFNNTAAFRSEYNAAGWLSLSLSPFPAPSQLFLSITSLALSLRSRTFETAVPFSRYITLCSERA